MMICGTPAPEVNGCSIAFCTLVAEIPAAGSKRSRRALSWVVSLVVTVVIGSLLVLALASQMTGPDQMTRRMKGSTMAGGMRTTALGLAEPSVTAWVWALSSLVVP